MRTGLISIVPLLFIGITAACTGMQTSPPVVGGDVDEQGCRASAGYQWCETTRQCERPWELAQSQGLEDSEEAFRQFCDGG